MAERFVLRKGLHYLHGENGWGERSCANEFTRKQIRSLLRDWLPVSPFIAVERAGEIKTHEERVQMSLAWALDEHGRPLAKFAKH